ncbi:hypothetical protein Hanom_Chr15g01341001 [Helianthus anomalus]
MMTTVDVGVLVQLRVKCSRFRVHVGFRLIIGVSGQTRSTRVTESTRGNNGSTRSKMVSLVNASQTSFRVSFGAGIFILIRVSVHFKLLSVQQVRIQVNTGQ